MLVACEKDFCDVACGNHVVPQLDHRQGLGMGNAVAYPSWNGRNTSILMGKLKQWSNAGGQVECMLQLPGKCLEN